MTDLSIVILSFNTAKTTIECLKKLETSLLKSSEVKTEVIVVDNGSSDSSVEELNFFSKKFDIKHQFIYLNENIGFTKGNNLAASKTNSEFLLFLNSDVLINNIDWVKLLSKFKRETSWGALTVRLQLENNEIDPASHRGIPNLWNSFCYFFKLEKITGNIPVLRKIFGGYHLKHLNLSAEHEVKVISGAFFMTRQNLFKRLRGFDEDFFMYGEDIDLSYRIGKLGYRIIYIPDYEATHLKYQSGKKGGHAGQRIAKYHFYKSMQIFYLKHFADKHSKFVNFVIDRIFQFIIPKKS